MVLIQENTFRSLQATHLPLILINEDQNLLGDSIEKGFAGSDFFDIVTELNGKKLDRTEAQQLVFNGEYKSAVIIPAGATQAIQSNVRVALAKIIMGRSMAQAEADSLHVLLYFDPVANLSLRNSIELALRQFTTRTEMIILFQTLFNQTNVSYPSSRPVQFDELYSKLGNQQFIDVKEIVAADNSRLLPNSVQHNVPAWTMFAMFFIVIPLATGMIKEREDGVFQRILTMPVSMIHILSGKMAVYFTVCITQFVLMMLMGLYVLPLLGMSTLILGSHPLALVVVVFCSAGAAIGYGLVIGAFATTHQQASSFGAISVIIAAAIGGIWVPVFIMPDIMQQVSRFSPLAWGLNAFHDVFLRNGDLLSVLPNALLLFGFSLFTLILAFVKFRRKTR